MLELTSLPFLSGELCDGILCDPVDQGPHMSGRKPGWSGPVWI